MTRNNCPNCRLPIPPPGETCPRCGGFTVSWNLLKREFDAALATQLWKSAKAAPEDPERPCPACRLSMRPLTLRAPDQATSVQLDLCTGCQAVWFDPKEIEALPPQAKSRILDFRDRMVRGPTPISQAALEAEYDKGISDILH